MHSEWVEIGRVRAVHPGKRTLRVTPHPARPHALGSPDWIRVMLRNGEVLRCKVVQVEENHETALTLSPGVSRDDIVAMKGVALVMPLEEVPPAPEGVWQVSELVGMMVCDEDDAKVGMVVEVEEGVAQDWFTVETTDGRRLLAPAVPELIVAVERDHRRVVVRDLSPFAVEQ